MNNVKSDAGLKALRSRRDVLVIEVSQALIKLHEAQTAHVAVKAKLAKMNEQISAMESAKRAAGVTITEHAYLRYIERVMGISLLEVRARMLPKSIEDMINFSNTCNVKTAEGHMLVVKNKTVVSVVKD